MENKKIDCTFGVELNAKFNAHVKHNEQHIADIKCSVTKIEKSIETVKKAIHDLGYIKIQVGNGVTRNPIYKRDEFFQMLYDRPKDTFKLITTVSDRTYKIMRAVYYLFVALGIIYMVMSK